MTDSIQTAEMLIQRSDLRAIKDMIADGSRILDLGCGSGRLLKALKLLKKAKVMGVEVDEKKLLECSERGVPVIQANLDDELVEFSDHTYDYVILSRTLQAVRRPDLLLNEMLRIGKTGIISFMNFGHINARIQLVFGNMPVNTNLPRPWYDTSTIHPGTIADLRNLFKTLNIKVIKEIPLSNRGDFLPGLAPSWPNLFASNCIFVITK